MAKLEVDGALLRGIIGTRFQRGVDQLLEEWDARQDNFCKKRPPDRSTIYRWLNGGLPHSSHGLLTLCGLLDVDPFCVLQLESQEERNKAVEVLTLSYMHENWDQPALAYIKDFLGRQAIWPPRKLSTAFFGREWFTEDFEHDPAIRADYYCLIELRSREGRQLKVPHVFHFSFRHPTLFGGRWLQYGIVIKTARSVTLLHINGYSDSYELCNANLARVETRFGSGPAVFRVASLHDFALEIKGEDSSQPKVQFPA